MQHESITRRGFVVGAGVYAGSLVISCKPRSSDLKGDPLDIVAGFGDFLKDGVTRFSPQAFVKLTPDGSQVLFALDRVEMGQGTTTSHAMMVAEELEIDDFGLITPIPAEADNSVYMNANFLVQVTGSSTSTATSWEPLRIAAATLKDVILQAAADSFDIKDKDEISLRNLTAKYAPGSSGIRSVRTQQLMPAINAKLNSFLNASRFAVGARDLKKTGFLHFGKSVPRLDLKEKIQGTAIFGIDVGHNKGVFPDGVLTAMICRKPHAASSPGVAGDVWQRVAAANQVTPVPLENGAVAVVGKGYWRCFKAIKAMVQESPQLRNSSGISQADIENGLKNSGNRWAALPDLDLSTRISGFFRGKVEGPNAVYQVPYAPHSTLEPMNCTVQFNGSTAIIYAPTQMQSATQKVAAETLGLSDKQVRVITTHIGGAFGRRINQDFVVEACQIAKKMQGQSNLPIKLIWSREDDFQHDYFRPAARHEVKGALFFRGETPNAHTWDHKVTSPSIVRYLSKDFIAAAVPGFIDPGGRVSNFMGRKAERVFENGIFVDPFAVEGAKENTYNFPRRFFKFGHYDPEIKVGFWRSVGHSHTAFAVESYLDELAEEGSNSGSSRGLTGYDLRRALLAENKGEEQQRLLRVLQSAHEGRNKRGRSVPGRVGSGYACHYSFKSYAAAYVEASVENGTVHVSKVVVAVDCGFVLHPDSVAAQVEGSVVWGLSAALKQEITFLGGRVEQENFHQCDALRIHEMPMVHYIPVNHRDASVAPTGIGEPVVPVIAPALCNALRQAGVPRSKLRKLPLRL